MWKRLRIFNSLSQTKIKRLLVHTHTQVSELQPSWRDEVVVEPTEGWVSVSSPVKEKESNEVALLLEKEEICSDLVLSR